MGKYIKKSKITGNVFIMDCSSGVRTRARTLALQKLQSSPDVGDSVSYLQLRSRRLEKPLHFSSETKKQQQISQNPNCNSKAVSSSVESVDGRFLGDRKLRGTADYEELEASFADNTFECDSKERGSSEKTPCSLIKDSDIINTPGSTTRRTCSPADNRVIQSDFQRNIPTALEIEKLFSFAERQQQQRLFIQKYNFDIVNDTPLPGRYEWVKLSP